MSKVKIQGGMTVEQKKIVKAMFEAIQNECSHGIVLADTGAPLARVRAKVRSLAKVISAFDDAIGVAEGASAVIDRIKGGAAP